MQTNTEVLFSRQDILNPAFPKQAPPIARIRDLRGITGTAKNALHSLHSRQPHIFPGMRTLARDMCVSLSTARRAVRELVQAGYVQGIHRTSQTNPRINQTNLYVLTIPGATPNSRIHAIPPVSVTPPPPVRVTPPPGQCDTPPPVRVTPEVSIEVFNISNKRERERALSPGNQSSKETITCPQCQRAWTANFGLICHTCKMEVPTIQRNIEERKSREEAFLAEQKKEADANLKEVETNRQKREAQLEAEDRTQKQKAEQPEKSPVKVETQENLRKKLMDILNKPFNPKIGKRFEFAMGGD